MSDEFDLDILKTVKTPRPDAETRDRAMREALAAFDDEKKSAATQGSASGSRLMTILQWSWSTTMETLSKGRLMSGTAIATILAVPLAGYLAFMVMNDGYRPGFTGSQPMELAAGNTDDRVRREVARPARTRVASAPASFPSMRGTAGPSGTAGGISVGMAGGIGS